MPVLVKYSGPIFWIPVNAIGSAATIDTEIRNMPAKINFYWSGVMLATRNISQNHQVRHMSEFIKKAAPFDGDENILHYVFNGDDFMQIADPHWVPGIPSDYMA